VGSCRVGRWLIPLGPTFWGAPVLTFTALTLLIAFVTAAMAPVVRRPTVPPPVAVALGLFLRPAMLMLALALVAAYAVARRSAATRAGFARLA